MYNSGQIVIIEIYKSELRIIIPNSQLLVSDFTNDLEWIDCIWYDEISNNLHNVSGFNGIYLIHPKYSCCYYYFVIII